VKKLNTISVRNTSSMLGNELLQHFSEIPENHLIYEPQGIQKLKTSSPLMELAN
jgi:hypothetical protein